MGTYFLKIFIFFIALVFCKSEEINQQPFLKFIEGETVCKTPVECYLEAIKMIKDMKEELKAKFDQEKKELEDKFNKKEEEFKSIFQEKYLSLEGVSPIGQINYYSINNLTPGEKNLPKNWTLCDGKALSRTEYSELFMLIGTLYGSGDGKNTFNIPDMRGRVIVGSGSGQGLKTYNPGDKGGEETHTLSKEEMPSHSHHFGNWDLNCSYFGDDGVGRNGKYPFQTCKYIGGSAQTMMSTEGNSYPHNIMQPYISIHPIIRIK